MPMLILFEILVSGFFGLHEALAHRFIQEFSRNYRNSYRQSQENCGKLTKRTKFIQGFRNSYKNSANSKPD